jgi:hypothetical protein
MMSCDYHSLIKRDLRLLQLALSTFALGRQDV